MRTGAHTVRRKISPRRHGGGGLILDPLFVDPGSTWFVDPLFVDPLFVGLEGGRRGSSLAPSPPVRLEVGMRSEGAPTKWARAPCRA